MPDHCDEDGDSVLLTEEDKAMLQLDLHDILEEMEQASQNEVSNPTWRELDRQRRHLVKELDAGRRLPLLDED